MRPQARSGSAAAPDGIPTWRRGRRRSQGGPSEEFANPPARAKKASATRAPQILCFMHWLTWSLLSALFAGLTAILAKIGVRDVDSNLATAVRTTVVLLFAWAVVPLTSALSAVSALSRRTLLFLALSGLATGLSWLCYFRALQLGDASKVAPIDKLSVVFVLVFAAIFLGETMTFKAIVGGALITAGAVVLALK